MKAFFKKIFLEYTTGFIFLHLLYLSALESVEKLLVLCNSISSRFSYEFYKTMILQIYLVVYVLTTGLYPGFKITSWSYPNKNNSAKNSLAAFGFDLLSTKTIPFLIPFGFSCIHFYAKFIGLIDILQIYPTDALFTFILLHCIPVTSTL